MRHVLSTVAAIALSTACSGEGNTGRVSVPNELAQAVPWTNGALPNLDDQGLPVRADTPFFPPIGRNTPDPGSRPIDCSGLEGIELAAWVEDFEPSAGVGVPDKSQCAAVDGTEACALWGAAEAWSSYDDGSFGAFRVPGDASWYPGLATPRQYGEIWGLAADRVAGPSCDGTPNNFVFHFKGGRFNWYGAGTEHPLATGSAAGAVCPINPNEPRADFCTDENYWDLSSYDGFVFWARRGPDSTPNVLFGMQNIYTSSYLARGDQTYCKRIKECTPTCHNDLPCVADDNGIHRCVPEGAEVTTGIEPALVEEVYPRCGPSTCSSPPYDPDPDFNDTECKPHEFSGKESSYYCYGEEPPPPEWERCDDAFVVGILLSTDWQLYKLPFSEFRQVGFGKQAPALDLTTVYSVGFGFPVGFADVYVDNMSFYRELR